MEISLLTKIELVLEDLLNFERNQLYFDDSALAAAQKARRFPPHALSPVNTKHSLACLLSST